MCSSSIQLCAGVVARRVKDFAVLPNVPSLKEPQMPIMISRIRHFLAGEDGPTTAEYAVLLVFVVPVIITAVASIGTSVSSSFSLASSAVGGGS